MMTLTNAIEARLAHALTNLYTRQSADGQASLLGFFHLLEGSSDVAVRLSVDRSGDMTLTLETLRSAAIGEPAIHGNH